MSESNANHTKKAEKEPKKEPLWKRAKVGKGSLQVEVTLCACERGGSGISSGQLP